MTGPEPLVVVGDVLLDEDIEGVATRLAPDAPQVLYDGPPEGLETCPDPRVHQFVAGEAGERLRELAELRETS